MSLRLTRLLIALCVLSCGAEIAMAEGRYEIFAGANYSDADNVFIGGHNLDFDEPPTLDPDGSFSGTSWRLGARYLWRGWAGLELGIARFGKEDRFNSHFIEFVCPGVCPPGEGVVVDNVVQRGSTMWLALAPTFQHGNFEVFGKVGAARTTIESSQASRRPPNRLRETETDFLFGVGAAYYFSGPFGVRLDAERLGDRAHQIGVALTYRF